MTMTNFEKCSKKTTNAIATSAGTLSSSAQGEDGKLPFLSGGGAGVNSGMLRHNICNVCGNGAAGL